MKENDKGPSKFFTGDSESSDDYKEAKGSEYSEDFSDCKTIGSGDETNEE